MPTPEERRRRGQETVKKYRSCSGTDPYACAADAIADILLFVAQTENEATQLLQSAEMDFRSAREGEDIVAEG